jgi:LuxR family maltose regulon positive regulatory protein
VEVEGIHASSSQPSFDLVESKLRPPLARPGIVARTALIDRLVAASGPAVISVVAPAGYGKTTLLAQWAERKVPRVGWVSVDDRDNDPVVLLTYVAVALDRVEAIDPRVFRALASSGAGVEVPRRLVAAMAGMGHPVALVIDNVEVVTNPESLDAIAGLALGLPMGSQLAIGSRDVLPLPTARLRAQGAIVEVGVDELAMDSREAGSLLKEAGVELGGGDLDELVGRTEGWPVGLYLAALAVNAGGSPAAVGAGLTGDDRYIGDYLRLEILDRVSPAEASFLTYTSVLERMCGPLCDAVVGVTGSAALLERLERRNLLVVPLDRRREWYRYHQMFRDLLVSELRRSDLGVIPELHRRAAAWCEANGMPENAIDHSQAAGDADTVARLVLQNANPVWASGRSDTVLRWMEWFESNDLIARYPGTAVNGALLLALAGRPAGVERWADAAEATSTTGALTDGSTIEAMLAYLRANLCRNGIEAMRRDAQVALHGLSATSPFRANMIQVEGLSHLLEGDIDRADASFARAVDEATRFDQRPFVALLLADRGTVALERHDPAAAGTFADRALTILHDGLFDDYWTSALVYAWTARVAALRGDSEQARQLVARAARLRPLLTYALPVESARALLEMARAYIALADPGGARAVLREASDIVQQRPALGNLPQQVDEVRAKVDTIQAEGLGASSLTTAELRLLPLLPTHLTFREVGERLYLSRHTVKTQVISIYRKLGVSSRSAAIDRMRELGLLEHT